MVERGENRWEAQFALFGLLPGKGFGYANDGKGGKPPSGAAKGSGKPSSSSTGKGGGGPPFFVPPAAPPAYMSDQGWEFPVKVCRNINCAWPWNDGEAKKQKNLKRTMGSSMVVFGA